MNKGIAMPTVTPRFNIDTCALLVEIGISVWTARKLDRKVSDEVMNDKHAQSKSAARVNKHLLAGRNELEVIAQHAGKIRSFVYDNTLPWSDNGMRLLPTQNYFGFTAKINELEDEFEKLVDEFVLVYPTLITAQAMALGDMFRRDEYPSPSSIKQKFSINVNYMPVPSRGDFRVDIGNAAQKELAEKLEQITNERVNAAMNDIRTRMKAHLERMSDRLTSDDEGGELKSRRFHDTLITGAIELCDLARSLNVVGDATLEEARARLQELVAGIDAPELRKNHAVREDVKKNVDAILDKFKF